MTLLCWLLNRLGYRRVWIAECKYGLFWYRWPQTFATKADAEFMLDLSRWIDCPYRLRSRLAWVRP